MTIKEQLQSILASSQSMERDFIAGLTQAEKTATGEFENWSAKDVVAHTNYWIDQCASQVDAWADGNKVVPAPPFDQANKEVFQQFAGQSWQQIQSFSDQANTRIVESVAALDDETLHGRSYASEGRQLWQSIVQTAYSHKLAHLSEYFIDRDMPEKAASLWAEWVDLVAPLDPSDDWQGAIHYNAACSLALADDLAGALRELEQGLRLQPSLRAWSRQDSDLENLHNLDEYKQLIAGEAWWQALQAGPIAESLADQYLRTIWMLREAIDGFEDGGWRRADSDYQRPAGLALHIIQNIDMFTSTGPGEGSSDPLLEVNWQDPDPAALPARKEVLKLLDGVEERLANYLVQADFDRQETQFPWTGSSHLSRVIYGLRHSQHHLADLASELKRQGGQPPSWY